MAAVGPSAWQVALVAALEVGIAAAVAAGAANWWHVPRGRTRAWGAAGQSRTAAGSAGSWPGDAGQWQGADASGHVIYLDRWAEDQDGARPASARRTVRAALSGLRVEP